MTEAVIIYLLRKSMDWYLYDNGLRHERVKDLYLLKSQTSIKEHLAVNHLRKKFPLKMFDRENTPLI